MKQLIKVLRCDLQVTIQEDGYPDRTPRDYSFVNHFQMEMVTLSPPQLHALLDHLCTRWAGGQALLDAIHRGNMST